jgi:beta-glucosidase
VSTRCACRELSRSEGQIPIYYNHLQHRPPPAGNAQGQFRSGYIDEVSPQYAFGHGLSYTRFAYGQLHLDRTQLRGLDTLTATVDITNTGAVAGEEVVQLYLRDPVASLVRPVQELRDFAKIALQPGETRTLRFVIGRDKLSFFNAALQWVAEPGEFEIMIGASSADIRLRGRFALIE